MSLTQSDLFLVALASFGLLIGSFLNVVIYRVPAGLSLMTPGSACPSCGHAVRPYDNIPVLSWVLLRGLCRDCSASISRRYPLVEAVTGVLFLAVGLVFGWSSYLPAVLVLAGTGVALFVIDLLHGRLPFSITGFTAGATVLALAFDAARGGTGPVLTALLSSAVWLAVYGGVWGITGGRGLGLGDVALAPVLGLTLGWLGWGPSLVALFGGFLIGAALGVTLLVAGRAGRRSRIPHGPFMLLGAALGLFAGQPLWIGYLRLVGL
jgi:leader peptidase (prepilin peptidase)/N-methyltransferase